MNVETELKLAIDETAIARLNDLPFLSRYQKNSPRTTHLETVYYDTPDYSLFHLRYVLRIRSIESRFVQTVKRDREGAAALTRRSEFERVLSGQTPDRAALPDDPDLDFLRHDGAWESLQAVVKNTFDRRIWNLGLDNGAEIELVADTGRVTAGGKSEPISELELELKRGTEADLMRVVRCIADVLPLRPESTSKSLRGFRLLGVAPIVPVYAALPDSRPGVSLGELFQQLLRSSVEQVAANRDAVLYSGTPETLRALRAGICMLRGWLSVFSRYAPAGARPPEMYVLREMMEHLDAADGLDFLCREFLAPDAGLPITPGEIERVKPLVELQRDNALGGVRSLMTEPRWGRALVMLMCWSELCDWAAVLSRGLKTELLAPADESIPRMVERYRGLVLKKGRAVLRDEAGNLVVLHTLVENLRHACRLLPGMSGYEPEPLSGTLDVLNQQLAEWRFCAQVQCELQRKEFSSGASAAVSELKALVSARMQSAQRDVRTEWKVFAEESTIHT